MSRRKLAVGSVALTLLLGVVGVPAVAYDAANSDGSVSTQAAASDQDAAETVGRIAGKIAREEPEHFVGSAVGPDADSVPRLYIKGQASAFVRELVADAGVPIEIIDDQPYNFTELEDRSIEVQQALLALGLEDFAIAVDVAGAGRIPVRVRLTATTPSEAAIREAVPTHLRADVVITMDADGDWEPDPGEALPSPMTSADPGATSAPSHAVAPTVAWGPMAMVQDPVRDSLDQGFGPGQLTVGEACVTFRREASETTLVFRDWQVIWLPGVEAIVLSDPAGELSMLKTGDELTLGGYAAWDEDTTGEPAAPPWLVEPGPRCPADLMLVHSAQRND